jgi:hypothetical protein
VVVYGSSLYMAGLVASLKADPSLDVVHIHSGSLAFEQCRQGLAPAAIVFDLGEMPPDLALAQLRACPGLMLIGVDPASEDILLLSGQQTRAVTMSDMALLITGTGTGGSQSSKAGGGPSTV